MPPSFLMYLTGVSLNVSISAMEIALGLLLIFLIAYLYINRIDVTADCPYFIPFFVYWLATVASLFLGSDSADVSGGVFALWNLLYFFAGYYFITASSIRLTLASLAFGGALLGASAMVDVIFLGSYRGDGFFSIYMSTGNVLAMGAVSALGVIVTRYERGFAAFLYLAALIIMVVGIYYTGTRGALLSFLASACLMLAVRFGLKGLAAAAVLLTGAYAAASFTHIEARFAELLQGFGNMETSHGWRIVLWETAWELIKEYPLFGIGYGAFQPMVTGSMPSVGLPMGHPHNAYINQLVLYGAAGFASFCWLYGKITYDLARRIMTNNYAFIGFFVMVVFFLEGVTENNFTDGEVKMFQMFFTGCMLGALRGGLKDTGKENSVKFIKNI